MNKQEVNKTNTLRCIQAHERTQLFTNDSNINMLYHYKKKYCIPNHNAGTYLGGN